MCEASAYYIKDGAEEKIMEAVTMARTGDNSVELKNLFGERKILQGKISEVDLTKNRIEIIP